MCVRHDLGIRLDVTTAERIVRERPRELKKYTPRQLRHYVTEGEVSLRHVRHVDRSKPGIFGVVRHRGRLRRLIIEGHHRGFGSRLAREDFLGHELTEAETAECLL